MSRAWAQPKQITPPCTTGELVDQAWRVCGIPRPPRPQERARRQTQTVPFLIRLLSRRVTPTMTRPTCLVSLECRVFSLATSKAPPTVPPSDRASETATIQGQRVPLATASPPDTTIPPTTTTSRGVEVRVVEAAAERPVCLAAPPRAPPAGLESLASFPHRAS